ncbi:rap guanine nucleotide exchange factor 1-like [Pseudoliparis swirei]|uniref:rap guanine nucleotide exchange factor 1-like n=1 Tax=Pseudoliparis swirei TaxID=2059687 RepID=UPI0024BE99E0|nr:rap guanine nucleotide exchange factor 1-like [Pseudoliparis swirei]
MSSRPEGKTASQFVSLTMRLKDKLHPQRIRSSERIKQTLSQKPKPCDLNMQHTLQHKPVCLLVDRQRAVVSSLQYFKALVDRLGVGKMVLDPSVVGGLLGGASSGVLEAVQTLVQLEPHLHRSKTICSCLTRLYLSVGQLIRWADQVMLQGVAHGDKDSVASVTVVIRAVLDGVKELVRLAAERGDSASLSLVQSPITLGQTFGFDNQLTSERTATCWSSRAPVEEDTALAPPKPPMPPTEPLPQVPLPQVSTQGLSPPALPPKRRQSLGPAPCRVAIVAPRRREPEVDRQEDECLKRCSSSSADSAAENTHCEDDPDYDFLHTDLSSSTTLPPLPHPATLPPALPEKRHCSTAETTLGQASFGFDSAPLGDIIGPDESSSSPLSPSGTPPPLPEKRRHIHQYLQFCSSYSDESSAMFYQRPLNFSQHHISRQRDLETTYHLPHLDRQTLDSAPSAKLLPPPVLPPKKRQQDPVGPYEEDQTRDRSQSVQYEEQQEEVLLTDQQEVLQRITMKPPDEDGPDVQAASPEILLVHATATDSGAEQVVYREAFLSTYRSFISPEDVIIKLQRRYTHLSELGEPECITAANNTFHLLVRVVDELCAIELDSDLLLLLMKLVFSLLIGGELGLARLLRSNILSKMEQKWLLISSPQSLLPLAARGVAARPGTLLDFRSQDLAEQLTLLDSELFCKIELPEVLLWSKEQNEERSPNLTAFTQHFNNVSFWVRSVIILQDKSQDREKLLLKFLKTMKHLRRLNNFNSYLSILSALGSAPLQRLDWQRNTSEALEEFSSLIDSSSSFRAYRAALAEVEPPCIPYLGLILQDLTFVHLGNPDTLMGSKVNFSKRWQQFNILATVRSYQQVPYTLQPNDDIISFFNDFSDHLAEEALWELSLRLRPRNTPRANQR